MEEIVVFTKNYGTNFTGATLATVELSYRWAQAGVKVVVICKNLGTYKENDKISIKKFDSYKSMLGEIKLVKYKKSIFYSDDHFAFLIKMARRTYIHTYHATWPEARNENISYFIKSFGFIPLYKTAIKNSAIEVAVSERYRKSFINKLNSKNTVIRNGMGAHKATNINNKSRDTFKIIMIGNVDERKYKQAIELFKLIDKSKLKVKIDIYGRTIDKNLLDKLISYNFVEFKGFCKNIEISNYDLYISSSTNENLSIAACEAIKNHVGVICFNVGAMDEIIKEGDNGFLILKGDNIAFFDKIKKVISGYKFEFNDTRINDFDWDVSAKSYLEIFEEVYNEIK